jgi:hypothetical protein
VLVGGVNFSESNQVFAPAVFKIYRATQEDSFFAPAVFNSRRAPCGCSSAVVSLCLAQFSISHA